MEGSGESTPSHIVDRGTSLGLPALTCWDPNAPKGSGYISGLCPMVRGQFEDSFFYPKTQTLRLFFWMCYLMAPGFIFGIFMGFSFPTSKYHLGSEAP